MTSEFFGRQRDCRFYTAGCGNKMAVSVTGPRAVNELGGPVTPGRLGASVTKKVVVLHPPPPPPTTDDTLDFLKEWHLGIILSPDVRLYLHVEKRHRALMGSFK